MRRLLGFIAPLFALALVGCTIPPTGSERLEFISRDYGFVDQLRNKDEGSGRTVYGWLMLPTAAAAEPDDEGWVEIGPAGPVRGSGAGDSGQGSARESGQ